MFYPLVVAVPEVAGKVIFAKRRGLVYVLFEVGRQYNADKQYNVPQRVLIGKLLDAKDPTRMTPNEQFFKLFPTGQPVDLPIPTKRSLTQKVGNFFVLEKIIKDLNLDKLMQTVFGKNHGLYLDLVLYFIVTEGSSYQHFEWYAFNHPLFTPNMHVYSDSTLSRLIAAITDDQISMFITYWNAGSNRKENIFVSCDSTNVNSQAGDLSLSAFGKAKVDVGTPIININLAFDQFNCKPLLFDPYHGALNDVKQLKSFVEKLKALGYKRITLILDRGYFSKENINFVEEHDFSLLMMVKGCKSLVSALVDKLRGSFEYDSSCLISNCGNMMYAKTVKSSLYTGDKQRYFHLCFSPDKMVSEQHALLDSIEQTERQLTRLIGEKEVTLTRGYDKYFDCLFTGEGENKRLFAVTRKHSEISLELKRCGYFCLISSSSMSAEEAYTIYSGRDSTEKLFSANKSFLGGNSLRVHTDAAVRGKIFLLFVALIVRNRFFNLLKGEMPSLNVKHNRMTVPSAIQELDTLEMSRYYGQFNYLQTAGLTRSQQVAFSCVGMSEDDVAARVKEMAQQLIDSEYQPHRGRLLTDEQTQRR